MIIEQIILKSTEVIPQIRKLGLVSQWSSRVPKMSILYCESEVEIRQITANIKCKMQRFAANARYDASIKSFSNRKVLYDIHSNVNINKIPS